MNLLAYIQGNRRGKEAHRIEKEAMRDPFLADALEGFDEVQGDHMAQITNLRNRIAVKERRSIQQRLYIGIAASLLFCITVGGYFLLNKKPESLIAMVSEESTVVYTDEMEITVETAGASVLSERNDIQNEDKLQATPAPVNAVDSKSILIVKEEDEIHAMAMVAEREDAVDEVLVSPRQAEAKDNDVTTNQRDEEAAVVKPVAASRVRSMNMEIALPAEPQPQIGMLAYEQYLKEAMTPLKSDECTQTNGSVEIEFTLQEGKPTDFIIKQSFCDAATQEAIRLIEDGSLWIGEDGQKVVLTVDFN